MQDRTACGDRRTHGSLPIATEKSHCMSLHELCFYGTGCLPRPSRFAAVEFGRLADCAFRTRLRIPHTSPSASIEIAGSVVALVLIVRAS